MQSRFDSSRHFSLHEIPTILARKLGISCKEIPRGKQGNFKFQTKEDAAQTAAGHTVTLIPPLQKIPSPGTPGTHSSGHRPRPVHVLVPGQTVGSLRCEQICPCGQFCMEMIELVAPATCESVCKKNPNHSPQKRTKTPIPQLYAIGPKSSF